MRSRFIWSISGCNLAQKLFLWGPRMTSCFSHDLTSSILFLLNDVPNLTIPLCAIKLPHISKLLKLYCIYCMWQRTAVCLNYYLQYIQSIATVYKAIHFQCFATNLLVYAISLPCGEPKSVAEPVVSQRMGICWAICSIMPAPCKSLPPHQVEGVWCLSHTQTHPAGMCALVHHR